MPIAERSDMLYPMSCKSGDRFHVFAAYGVPGEIGFIFEYLETCTIPLAAWLAI
jgi:hypothetical protein